MNYRAESHKTPVKLVSRVDRASLLCAHVLAQTKPEIIAKSANAQPIQCTI